MKIAAFPILSSILIVAGACATSSPVIRTPISEYTGQSAAVMSSSAMDVNAADFAVAGNSGGAMVGGDRCIAGAQELQFLVGMDANAAFGEVNMKSKEIQDLVIYAGNAEAPSMLPKNKVILEHSTPSVTDAMIDGGNVTRVYCNQEI